MFSHLQAKGGQGIRQIFTLHDHMLRNPQMDRGKIPNRADTAGDQHIADLLGLLRRNGDDADPDMMMAGSAPDG